MSPSPPPPPPLSLNPFQLFDSTGKEKSLSFQNLDDGSIDLETKFSLFMIVSELE